MIKENIDSLQEQAKRYWAAGHDEVYIANQFAEMGVDDETIDKVLQGITKLNKTGRKAEGLKLLIYGLSFIAVGLGLTWWSANWNFEYAFIVWGLPIAGVMTAVKGLGKILGN